LLLAELTRAPAALWLAVFGILALAIASRWYGLGREALWLDEAYSWWDANQSFADLWQLVPQCDPHPPLYFVLLKLWMQIFGDTPVAMRSLGACFSVATVGCVIAAGWQISARTGLIAGLLFATAPFQIEFAQDARPYALFSLGAALFAFGALRVLRHETSGHAGPQPSRIGGWAALTAGGIIAVWSNNTAILMLGALGLALLFLAIDPRYRRVAFGMLLALLAIGIAWLPYAPVFIEQARGVTNDFWIPRPDAWRFFNELRVALALASFPVLACMGAVWVAGLALLVRAGRRRVALILGALSLLPAVASFIISQFTAPIYLARALIHIAPAFVLTLAAGLALMAQRRTSAGLVALMVAVQLFAVARLNGDSPRKPPWNDLAQELALDTRRNSVVLTVPNEMTLPLTYALAASGNNRIAYGAPGDFPEPGTKARYPSGKCSPALIGINLNRIVNRVRGKSNVVLVTRVHNTYDPENRLPALLRSLGFRHSGTRTYHPGALIVMDFEKPATVPVRVRTPAPLLPTR
jgi:ribosomal protein S18 acetylase RimI-like enzyme